MNVEHLVQVETSCASGASHASGAFRASGASHECGASHASGASQPSLLPLASYQQATVHQNFQRWEECP